MDNKQLAKQLALVAELPPKNATTDGAFLAFNGVEEPYEVLRRLVDSHVLYADNIRGFSTHRGPVESGSTWVADPLATNEPEDPGGSFEPTYTEQTIIDYRMPEPQSGRDISYDRTEKRLYIRAKCIGKQSVARAIIDNFDDEDYYWKAVENADLLYDAFNFASGLAALKKGRAKTGPDLEKQVLKRLATAITKSGLSEVFDKDQVRDIVKRNCGIDIGKPKPA